MRYIQLPWLAFEMPTIRVDGIDFHVEEFGGGPPLFLLHGFTGSSASWAPIGDDFTRRHRVIAIDLIGHGATSAPADPSRYAFERALDDLVEIADQFGVARASWLGYSMGGRLALGLALRYPLRVSALILESATAGIQDDEGRRQRAEEDDGLANRIEDVGVEAFVDEWAGLPMWESQCVLPAEVRQHQHDIRLRNRAIGLANSLRGMGQGVQPSYWDRLQEIDFPVLLIAGALDRKYSGIAGQMGIRIPEATLTMVPGAGHAVHLEQPKQFTDEVIEFLAIRESIETGNVQGGDRWT